MRLLEEVGSSFLSSFFVVYKTSISDDESSEITAMAATKTLVLYPTSGRGHIVPMLEFGKLILSQSPDFSITVVISTQTTNKIDHSLRAAYPSISFHYLTTPEPDASSSPTNFLSDRRHTNPSLHSALSSISQRTNLRAFIIDFFNTPALEVGADLHIPTYYYFTSGAVGLAMFLYIPTLNKTIPQSLKDVGGQVLHIPGMPQVLASDIPDGINDRTSAFHQVHRLRASYLCSTSVGSKVVLIISHII